MRKGEDFMGQTFQTTEFNYNLKYMAVCITPDEMK